MITLFPENVNREPIKYPKKLFCSSPAMIFAQIFLPSLPPLGKLVLYRFILPEFQRLFSLHSVSEHSVSEFFIRIFTAEPMPITDYRSAFVRQFTLSGIYILSGTCNMPDIYHVRKDFVKRYGYYDCT